MASRRSHHKRNVNRRKQEDNLAVIFMGIVMVFIVCHFPRVLLSIHEMLIIKRTLRCQAFGKRSFPFWAIITSQFSHLLLVINSSVNSLIYCMLSSKFRMQAWRHARSWASTFKAAWLCFLGICCWRKRPDEFQSGSEATNPDGANHGTRKRFRKSDNDPEACGPEEGDNEDVDVVQRLHSGDVDADSIDENENGCNGKKINKDNDDSDNSDFD